MKTAEKILKNSDEIFALRRRVMAALYEAREIIGKELPRIKIRIVEFETDAVLGRCYLKKDFITISRELATWSETDLCAVVWHELAHAYFGAKHSEKCPLMTPKFVPTPKFILKRALKRIARAAA